MPTNTAVTTVTANVKVTTASGVVLAARQARRWAVFQNLSSSGNVFLTFGSVADSATGILLAPNAIFTLNSTMHYCGVLSAIVASGQNNLLVIEGY